MQKIVCLTYETDSGYISTQWFRNEALAELILEKSQNEKHEYYDRYHNGEIVDQLQFPDSLNLEKCGFSFSDSNFPEELQALKIKEIKEHKKLLDKKLSKPKNIKSSKLHKI